MKKFLSLLCALALVLSLGTVCFAAASTETLTLDYSMVDEDKYPGDWVRFTLNGSDLFDLYLPEGLEEQDLTDEDIDNGMLWCYADEEGHVFFISGIMLEDYGVTDFADLSAALKLGGFKELQYFLTNELGGLFGMYTTEEDITYCAVWVGWDDDAAIMFTFYPCETAEDQEYVNNMICSLSLPE